jgi:ABC-type multidrug transport system fused ATPase/permease subunit
MISVERINEYMQLEKETVDERVSRAKTTWPSVGEIQFDAVSFAYDDGQQTVLKNVSFKINGKEKIGIIGRTAAGKSTIFQTIFRMAESSGTVLIDGIDISQIGLHDLRSKIAIIPV